MLRVESGLASLDILLNGGLPLDPDVVFYGSRDDLTQFTQSILWQRLDRGDVCVYGTLTRVRDELIREWTQRRPNVMQYLETGRLEVLDYLSLADEVAVTYVAKIQLLFSITRKLMDPAKFFHPLSREFWRVQNQHPDRRFVAILDSIDQMIGLLGLDHTLRFKAMIDALLGETNSLGIGLLYKEFVSQQELDAVRNAASMFIELTRDPTDTLRIRVTKDLYADWTSLI